ncbi:PREDICTED: actin-related protein 2/3 complex subunit 5-like [Priapulus caudatus]|uniref:Actin-related protein 2/3 complex subunit 5 n=1 Tax=Priapulus caudatus TaxID=37621 RepID=A0ABM1FA74_PRICU|nr:PREDICTED: actin-related protein 2/3 complex subunit 5-like [Priapulus caudatus]
MSKATSSTKFRTVDVDQYNEDNYQDEQIEDASSAGPDENQVNQLLNMAKNVEALQVALKNPPIGSKNQAEKDRAVQLVIRVLLSFKASEIENAISKLDRDSMDILMKYIYRGFENPNDGSSGLLLTWHEKAFASGGMGCIMRVLTDRNSV